MKAEEPRLKVVVLCGRSPRHLYMANSLCHAAQVMAIVQETGGEWTIRKLLKTLRPATFARKMWRWLRDRRRYSGGGEARFFFPESAPKLEKPELVHTVPHINHGDVVALVDRLDPDLIAVFGTSLIRGGLLAKGRLGIINLHGGLSPEYRGADCTFWALYNQEPEKIGCTLHYIDVGIDTGRLVAHISPAVGSGDDELTLFWRAVRDSAAVYADLIKRLAHGEQFGVPQSSKGRLYQVKQRGWSHERRVDQLLHDGLLARQRLEPRVKWFALPRETS